MNSKYSKREFIKKTGIYTGLASLSPLFDQLVFKNNAYAADPLNAMMFGHTYPKAIKTYLNEFKSLSGHSVELETPAFPVYNQRADLELSSGTGAYDVLTMTFIYTGKWMGAGWSTKLNEFVSKNTSSNTEFDSDDFLAGAMSPLMINNDIYAYPFVAESSLMVYRKDILEKHGFSGPPETFDELIQMASKINSKDMAGYIGRGQPHSFHWVFPNFLFAYGGDFFVDPPNDLTPTLDSKEAIEAANVFVDLYKNHSAPGVVNFNEEDAKTAMQQGRGAMWIDALAWVGTVGDSKNSKVSDRIGYALPPGGPKGKFPQVAVHGFQIPEAAKRKDLSWEFIKWALSKKMMKKISNDFAYPAVARASILESSEYRAKYQWGGADIGALHKEVLKLAGSGYMAYRTVPVFPPVGNRLGIALIEACTDQKTVKKALQDCNKDVSSILRKAGYKVSRS